MRKIYSKSNFFIAFHCEISKNAAQIFVVLQKHFAALQSKKVSKKQSLSVVLLYNLGEYKCLKDKRKRGKQARPFHFVHLAGIEPARVLPH